jgi:DNA mismatch repair protein MutS
MSLIKDYFEKTKNHSDEFGDLTLVLMQNGAFFEVYGLKDNNENIFGCKILDFSRICDLNIVDKKAAGDKNVLYNDFKVVNAGFKTHLIEKYLKKMQEQGFTVAVYEEDEVTVPKITRSLTGIYSPGTFLSNETDIITNNTCCIWIEIKKSGLKVSKKSIYIGVAQIDIYTGYTSIMEYTQEYIKNPCTFDELEHFISVYNPSETIIISNLPQSDNEDIINFTNIKSKSLHFVSLVDGQITSKNYQRAMNCEKQVYQLQLLNRFYKINDGQSFMGIFNDNVYATQAFCYLLDFIYQHNPNLIYKISEPVLENNSKRLVLANHSLKQLNIIDDNNYKGKFSSVSKMLNECITSMGKRDFDHSFLNPITDINELNNEYNIIEHLINNFDSHANIKNILSSVKDMAKIMRQIILKKVTPKSIYQLYCGIIVAKTLYSHILLDDTISYYLKGKINGFDNILDDITIVTQFLEKHLILEDCKDIDNIQKIEQSFIHNGVDSILDTKIKTLMESQDQLECCRSYLSSLICDFENQAKSSKASKKSKKDMPINSEEEDTKIYVKIHETEKNNFSLIATERRCKIIEELIKEKKKGDNVTLKYNSSYYNKDATFTLSLNLEFAKQSSSNKSIHNNQINDLCRNVGSIKVSLIDTVYNVYQSIITNLQEYHNSIEKIIRFITLIDVIYSKAFISIKYNYCRPQIIETQNDNSFINVIGLRHCLIEKIQQSELYVTNDIVIGDGQMNGVLLYGTNAVGKTSFIRALGISVIMAQAGLYVPASSFKYRPYKYIFTRILGNDNIFKGLSTFAVEMSELRIILRLANKNSLVLGDELCSGTESISATSIFVAGIQKLYTTQCSFIFATHLHEIIDYDEIIELDTVRLKHMSVIYDRENNCLVYNRKLQDGPGNNMYGLEVCKSLALPEDFLEQAHNIRMKYHPESSSILGQKASHFNANKIKGICEKCNKNYSQEVHHLAFQQEADDKGIIKKDKMVFHKNNSANLLNLCQQCHNEMHKEKKQYKKTKTTKGIILEEV